MNQGNNFCRNCGCPLKSEDKFCKNCGTAINNGQVINNQENNNSISTNNGWQNNPNYYQNNNIPPKDNGTWKYIIIAIVLIFIIGIGVYLLIENNSKPSEPAGNNSFNNGSSNINTKSIYFKGFTFKIPSSYEYNIDSDTLSFGNIEDTWYSGLQIISGNYNILVSNQSEITRGMEARGFTVNSFKQKTYSGLSCLVMEVEGMGSKMIMAYVKANSSQVFVVSTLNLYKNYDYDLFEDTIKIIKTAL